MQRVRVPDVLDFRSLRSDWYASNQTVPRAIRLSRLGRRPRVFVGFPRQWLPLFEWFGVQWRRSVSPAEYIPLFSDQSEAQTQAMIHSARSNGRLRELVEATSHLDPILSDCLYRLDKNPALANCMLEQERLTFGQTQSRKKVFLNGWQSYGRAVVAEFESLAFSVIPSRETALALPCSLSRPYGRSRTHKRIWQTLSERGIQPSGVHQLVITSLGVVPQELWNHQTVLGYDAGVPDIHRVYSLMSRYFSRNTFLHVIDCLQFPPYSEMLRLLAVDGVISRLQRIETTPARWR